MKMSPTPIAAAVRRRKAGRSASGVLALVGMVLAFVGLVAGVVPLFRGSAPGASLVIGVAVLVAAGVIVFFVGFAIRLAGNSTLKTAIDRAAFGLLGRDVPPAVSPEIRGIHNDVFRKAVIRHIKTGEDLDTAFRTEFAALMDRT